MSDESPPYWVLISVLFSTRPLTPSLAMDLYTLAHRLYQRDEPKGEIRGDLVQGTVENKKRDVLVGAIGGPMFEAELETERGHASVRFVLTRQGLEHAPREAPPSVLN